MPNVFWKTFTPLFRVSDALASGSHYFISGFENAAELATKNEQLIENNDALTNENQMLIKKTADISALSCDVGASGKTSDIYAGVVTRPPESPYDTLVLGSGKNAGVKIGMEVFGEGCVPLGVVSSVLSDFSTVTLFSSPSIATSGWIGNTSTPITIFGAGAGAMSATMSRSANSAVGDIVFVPGPGALPIGKVASVGGNSSSPSVTLHIVSSANLFSITWVIVRDTGASIPISATSTLP